MWSITAGFVKYCQKVSNIVQFPAIFSVHAGMVTTHDGCWGDSRSKFRTPSCIAFDERDGSVYVGGDSRIHKVSSAGWFATPPGNALILWAGNITAVAGNGMFGAEDGPASQATFELISDLIVDPRDGSLYVSVCNFNIGSGKIRKFFNGITSHT